MKGGRRSTSWKRGESGNPGGRPTRPATVEARQVINDVKEAAKALTGKAIATLDKIMGDATAPASARIGAATAILDRGWGRPTQPIEEKDKPFRWEDLVAMSMADREEKARLRAEGKLIDAAAVPPEGK
jgi:hypothetical protein